MSKEFTKTILPEVIQLKDGRVFPVKTLLNRVKNKSSINLITKKVHGPRSRKTSIAYKYTIEERVWQAQAPIEEIATRYAITLKQAGFIKYNSHVIVGRLGRDYDNISNEAG